MSYFIFFKKKSGVSIRAVVSLGTGQEAIQKVENYNAHWRGLLQLTKIPDWLKGRYNCFNILLGQVNMLVLGF